MLCRVFLALPTVGDADPQARASHPPASDRNLHGLKIPSRSLPPPAFKQLPRVLSKFYFQLLTVDFPPPRSGLLRLASADTVNPSRTVQHAFSPPPLSSTLDPFCRHPPCCRCAAPRRASP